MTALATGVVGRLTVRAVSGDRANRFGELTTDALAAPVERGAFLVVRRIAVCAASAQQRDSAVADEVADAARTAHRPRRGHVPGDATAVLFRDHAEMLATLLFEIARGVAADHWWWRFLDVEVTANVADAIVDNIVPAPPALDSLDSWDVSREVLGTMTQREVAFVADALWQAHVDPMVRRPPELERNGSPARSAGEADPAATARRAAGTATITSSLSHLAFVRHVIAGTRSGPMADRPARGEDVPAHDPLGRPDPKPPFVLGPEFEDVPPSPEKRPAAGPNHHARLISPPPVQNPNVTRYRPDRPPAVSAPTHPEHRSEPATPASARPPEDPSRPEHVSSTATAPDAPSPRGPIPSLEATGFPTQFAGTLYLVGALAAVEPPDPYPWGHERWALLAAIAHHLVEGAPDPIWQFLRDLAAHPNNADPFPPPHLADRAEAACDLIVQTFELDDGDLAALVATPGIVHATSTHIDVQIDMQRISMTARVRGLDADPGWCPELGYVIRFHFEGS